MVRADTRQARLRLQEFRSRYRFEPSGETEALVQAKCAVLDVLSLVLQFQVNSLLTACFFFFIALVSFA